MRGKRKRRSSGQRYELGQTMVEFALVLPALLLTLLGIADFGRLVAVYSNLFNAAREGARYGVVNPQDVVGISLASRNNITLVDPAGVNIYVEFDSGPGTPNKSYDAVTIGDRVIVKLDADVEMITPPIRAIARQLHLETVSMRTISTLGEIGNGEFPPSPPTATPDGTTTPSPSPTGTATNTPTATPTSTPTPTDTPVPGVAPIEIAVPLSDGETLVTGTAEPGEIVYLRDIQNPSLNLSTTVNADGTFVFNLPTPLVGGHVIVVQGYGSTDYAIVSGGLALTATPLATTTPAPTATPTGAFIVIVPSCGPVDGFASVIIRGYNWPDNDDITIEDAFGTTLRQTWQIDQAEHTGSFETTVTIDASSPGMYTITASSPGGGSDSKDYTVPCPITPTPTLGVPNLVVQSINFENQGTISTYDPLTFTVAVRNIGAAAANSLFWVDLYTDPAVEPPTPDDLFNEASVAWAAVSSLAQDEVISLTLHYREGFKTTGDHTAYALADTWRQIAESIEADNVGGPVTITVELEGSPPLPTPTPTPGGVAPGAISGSTWLYINGEVVPQSRVNVYVYNGIDLIAETLSDADGNYLLGSIPEGTYTVIGETVIDSALYTDIVLDIPVVSGQTTEWVTLVLH